MAGVVDGSETHCTCLCTPWREDESGSPVLMSAGVSLEADEEDESVPGAFVLSTLRQKRGEVPLMNEDTFKDAKLPKLGEIELKMAEKGQTGELSNYIKQFATVQDRSKGNNCSTLII